MWHPLFQMMLRCVVVVLLLVPVHETSNDDWQSTKNSALSRNLFLLNNSMMSDIKITFEQTGRKWFYAHKHILATRSPVFYTKFYQGEGFQNVSIIHLPEAGEENVMEFLRFLYTDDCKLTPEIALSVSKLAQKFIIPLLKEKCVDVLLANTTVENVFALRAQTRHLEDAKLQQKFWDVIDTQTRQALSSGSFVDIPRTALIDLLKRDSLQISEIELFNAVLRWANHQCSKQNLEITSSNRRRVLGDVVYHLRFLLMSQEEFAANVPATGILTDGEIVSIYQWFMGHTSQDMLWEITKARSEPTSWLVTLSRLFWLVGYYYVRCAAVGWPMASLYVWQLRFELSLKYRYCSHCR